MEGSSKRKSDQISPLIGEIEKRYSWDTDELLTQNKYYLPSNLEKTITDNETSTSQTLSTRKTKIPPIYLQGETNYKEVISDIKRMITESFTTTYNVNGLRINLNSEEDYRELTKFYTENNIKYHTFQNPNTKPLSVVLKNIPLSLTNEEIKEELDSLNLPVIKVNRLLNNSKRPLPICAVELIANDDAKQIFKLERLGHSVIVVEQRRKSQGTPQCYRCQRIGHTKNYCQLEPRCVKCLGKHLHTQCTKQLDEPPTCVNCGEHHPANFRGCKYFTDHQLFQKSAANIKPSQTVQTTVRPNINNINAKARNTYAKIAANKAQNNESNFSSTTKDSPLINQILQFIMNLITPYLQQIKTFVMNNIFPNLFNGP